MENNAMLHCKPDRQINNAIRKRGQKGINTEEKIRRLFVKKGGYKEKHMKGTPTSKYAPIPSCPQMNASQAFMNHQNVRLIFALGEAAGREFSEGISFYAG